MIEIKTTTYGCICGYHVDAPLFENQAYFSRAFPVPYGTCPSCGNNQLVKILDLAQLSTHTTLEANDIAALTVTETDANDMPVMIDSGEVKQEIGIVDGKPAVVETPIFVEKTRELTAQEQQAKLDDANKAIDDLSTKEFNPNSIG